MPQRMWRTDRQTWRCEGCGTLMVRTYTPGGGWSPRQPAASEPVKINETRSF
jgi:hypothetical protein